MTRAARGFGYLWVPAGQVQATCRETLPRQEHHPPPFVVQHHRWQWLGPCQVLSKSGQAKAPRWAALRQERLAKLARASASELTCPAYGGGLCRCKQVSAEIQDVLDLVGLVMGIDPGQSCGRLKRHEAEASVLCAHHLVPGEVDIQDKAKLGEVVLQALTG